MMIRDQTIHWEAKHNFERGQPRGLGQSARAQFRQKGGDCLASFHTERRGSATRDGETGQVPRGLWLLATLEI